MSGLPNNMKNVILLFLCIAVLTAMTANAFGQDTTGLRYGHGVAIRSDNELCAVRRAGPITDCHAHRPISGDSKEAVKDNFLT
jgi:hypothetical protein